MCGCDIGYGCMHAVKCVGVEMWKCMGVEVVGVEVWKCVGCGGMG